jgi:hypothetical protein
MEFLGIDILRIVPMLVLHSKLRGDRFTTQKHGGKPFQLFRGGIRAFTWNGRIEPGFRMKLR